MPVPVRSDSVNIHTDIYRSASQIPSSIIDLLQRDALNSNIILPHINKSLSQERSQSSSSSQNPQIWIACFTSSSRGANLDFLLAVTNGPLGTYPAFIYTARPIQKLDSFYLTPRIGCLVDKLSCHVPHHRIFSVFAVTPVAKKFAELWTAGTGIPVEPEDYYAATFTYCNLNTLTKARSNTIMDGYDMIPRRASEADIPQTAALCHGFAATSAPFVLSMERATQEAKYLTRSGQLWVLEYRRINTQESQIACIVAVTRSNESVAAITKVYTPEAWRRRGCAARLVRFVTSHLLKTEKKDNVVLYVAHGNIPAEKAYHAVGFVGLSSEMRGSVHGVEPWLERGFDRRRVQLGHW